MEQYIDKSTLVVEIEKRIEGINPYSQGVSAVGCSNTIKHLRGILSFIGTLEVKEVDLDLEITLWANAIPEIRLDDVERLAKHFFELGLKAQKG